jgi:hypothetical protein
MRLPLVAIFSAMNLFSLMGGCSVARDMSEQDDLRDDEGAFSSKDATLLEFEFDGQMLTQGAWNPKQQIQDQLLYTIGHLNGNKSVGRLDRLDLTNVTTTPAENGLTKVTYHAKLPVAWGSKSNLPSTYEFTLPLNTTYQSLNEFTEKYKHDCVDWGAHDVDSGSMWYYYRPAQSNCKIDAAHVFKTTAKVTKSALNTTGKYPEYNKVWEDGALNVVAVFGKYEDGATTTADAGVSAYNRFVTTMQRELSTFNLVTKPATLPASPGVETPDITFDATLAGGKKVTITALLVDNVRTAGAAFDARYEQLSTTADVITYNGHAGLGDNVRALARKGKWVAGKYLITFMNGCDTFAYVDGSLAETRAKINPDDPSGTKYMEIVTNAMPAFFSSMPTASLSLIRGLMKHDKPQTYEQIFDGVDRQQVIVVTGEEDNTYTPGGSTPPPSGGEFTPFTAEGTVAKAEEKQFTTAQAPAGKYTVEMTGDNDADLYVKIGAAPTARVFDCRPYKSGSAETCTVTLTSPATIGIMVRGWATSSSFKVVARKS